MSESVDLFVQNKLFKNILLDDIIPALKICLKTIVDEYILIGKNSPINSGLRVIRTFQVSRFIILNFLESDNLFEMVNLLDLAFKTLIPEVGLDKRLSFSLDEFGNLKSDESVNSISQIQGLAAGLVIGAGGLASSVANSVAGSFISRLGVAKPNSFNSRNNINSNNINFIMLSSETSLCIPSHIVGCCLELLTSLFLNENCLLKMSFSNKGVEILLKFTVKAIESICYLIDTALENITSIQDFENTVRSSQLVTCLEGFLTGAESDHKNVIIYIRDMISACPCLVSTDSLILAFYLLQIVVRLNLKFVLSLNKIDDDSFLISPYISKTIQSNYMQDLPLDLFNSICKTIQLTNDIINNSCSSLLNRVNDPTLTRRSLGILSELILTNAFLNLSQDSTKIISHMCKFVYSGGNINNSISWKNIQAFVKVVQLTNILANSWSDWDMIIETFNHLHSIILDNHKNYDEILHIFEIDKILIVIERFKFISLFLSDESLVKLMTSLLTYSMNSLFLDSQNSNPVDDIKNRKENISTGLSFKIIIEIAKLNLHRISLIWQMVTSFLKLVVSNTNADSGKISICATFELITTYLLYLKSPKVPPENLTYFDEIEMSIHRDMSSLNDDVIFNFLLPSFESAFYPKHFMKESFIDRYTKSKMVSSSLLTQAELFSALITLSSIGSEDILIQIMNELFDLLQEDNKISSAGWKVIISLMSSVASSFSTVLSTEESNEYKVYLVDENISDSIPYIKWPKGVLSKAFSCLKLLVDDFLESFPLHIIKDIIICLSNFSAQTYDINISLTSVEMLWKVVDHILTPSNIDKSNVKTSAVLDVMMSNLLTLSMDSRPEIRNCALNTLFSCIISNSDIFSSLQWKRFFEDIVFALFSQAEERSCIAMKSNETAIAPELKKGIKMTIHHSRDTAHKQWSESRVLALKGFGRIVKTCLNSIISETWFLSVWIKVLDIFYRAVYSFEENREVSIAATDTIFAMLKSVSSHNYFCQKSSPVSFDFENFRSNLWNEVWSILKNLSRYSIICYDIALQFLECLKDYFVVDLESNIKNELIFDDILYMIKNLSRPRISFDEMLSPSQNLKPVPIVEIQINRILLFFIKTLRSFSEKSFTSLISFLYNLSYSSVDDISIFEEKDKIILGKIDIKLRTEINTYIEYLLENMIVISRSGNYVFKIGHSNEEMILPKFVFCSNFLNICVDFSFTYFLKEIFHVPLVRRTFDHLKEIKKLTCQGQNNKNSSLLLSWALNSLKSSHRESLSLKSGEIENSDLDLPSYFNEIKNSRNVWSMFILHSADLVNIKNSIKILLSSSTPSLKQWSSIMVTTTCIITPWHSNEILFQQGNILFSIIDYCRTIEEIFDLIYDYLLADK